MQKAKALLMTINWYEPFGLVMAEAMSCGTPVIGFDRGAVSELVVEGKTGFLIPPDKGVKGLKEALGKIDLKDTKGATVQFKVYSTNADTDYTILSLQARGILQASKVASAWLN